MGIALSLYRRLATRGGWNSPVTRGIGMSDLRAVWCALALSLMFLIPAAPGVGPTEPVGLPQSFDEASYVRIHIPAEAAATLGPGVEIVESYENFILARARPDAVDALRLRGVSVQPEEPFALRINGYIFDTRDVVQVPSFLAAKPVLDGFGYHLVQFVGPIKDEWRGRMEANGAQVLAYVPNHAYLVRAAPASMPSIRSIPSVQWTGEYHPAFKVSPEFATAMGPVDVKIIVHEGESVGGVVATLGKMGLRVVGRFASGAGLQAWGTYDGFGLVKARIDPSLLIPIAQLKAVRFLEPQYEMRTLHQSAQFVLQTNAAADGPGVRKIWDQGIRGQNQVIAVSDSGLDYDHTQFRHSQGQASTGSGGTSIYNFTDTARRKVIRYHPMSAFRGVDPFTGGDPYAIKDTGDLFCFGSVGHGTGTSSAAGGDDFGITPTSPNDGMAREAKLVMLDIGSADANGCDALTYVPDDYGDMYGAAYVTTGGNARIFSNSWGGQSPSYTLEAAMVDRFTWTNPDALVLFAVGNGGQVQSPATAKSLMAVGAACSWTNREATAGCAGGGPSTGPTADGRRKPDLGTFYETAAPDSGADSDGNLGTFNSGLGGFGGTSYATPLAAGMTALVRQYFREGWYPTGSAGGVTLTPSAALMKAVMTAGTVVMTGASACAGGNLYPNNFQGWGRVFLDEALYFTGDARRLWVYDHPTGIQTGDAVEYRLRLSSSAKLRVMLAWSDFPAIENANPALVNNLDLEVIDPSGTSYKGNVQASPCNAGQTTTGGLFDDRNPLEGVARNSPATGEWRIRVTGANVGIGPQRFALAVVGGVDLSYGVLTMDKTVYGEGDGVSLEIRDGDASGSPTVQITSNTEPAGEAVVMTQVGGPASATFRGFIPLEYGAGIPADGNLQVSCGDTITATYNDASPPHVSTATGRVECHGPAISNVRVISITNAAATITWTTDRASDSFVDYGPTIARGTFRSDSALTTSHRLTLTGLTTAQEYFFDVASTRLGHTTLDDNEGRHYRFETTAAAEILLVIGDTSQSGGFSDGSLRLDMYRDALASAGWTWNEWDATGGDPPLSTLQSYKAVLWQSGLEQYPPFADSQLPLITNYINGGGRFYYSGHDAAWASCDFVNSAYATAPRCNFVRSVLKGSFTCDPGTAACPGALTQEVGFAGDPISSAYTGGVPYVEHRAGGAGDEVAPLTAGGATVTAWRTNTGNTPPDDGLRWESSANNGSASPGCVWCGARSRVVSYFFEFTGVSYVPLQAGSPQRTDILNKTIIWLLGRSPPVVRVTFPNGGETFTTNTLNINWQRSALLSSQEIWYSNDDGTSWNFEASVPPGDQSRAIDISNVTDWPNGDRYRVRVTVIDLGSPAFKAQDASDSSFTIRRGGGDLEGPVVRPGSLRTTPDPAKEGATFQIDATIDDTLRGGSNIAMAEFFVQTTMPIPAQYGSGTPLNAVDGSFNETVEEVRITVTASWPADTVQCVWVHGEDDATPASNWGGFGGGNATGGCRSFLVLSVGPPPNPPLSPMATLVSFAANVRISWTIPGGPSIDRFEIYFSTLYDSTRSGYSLLPGAGFLPGTQDFYDHILAGSNTSSYYYYIRAVNTGGVADSVEQAGKYHRSLTTGGMHLVSSPVIPSDTSITSVLQTVTWRTVRTFVATDAADPWKARYIRGTGDLLTATVGTPLWVDLVAADEFHVAGQVPLSTQVTVVPGWNFIGYASFTPLAASSTLSAFGLTRLEVHSAAGQHFLASVALTTTLQAGRAYWVYLTVGGAWTVGN